MSLSLFLQELVRIGNLPPWIPDGHLLAPVPVRCGPSGVITLDARKGAADLLVPRFPHPSRGAECPVNTLEYTLGCGTLGRAPGEVWARHEAYRALLARLPGEGAAGALAWIESPDRPLVLAFGPGVTPDHVAELAAWAVAHTDLAGAATDAHRQLVPPRSGWKMLQHKALHPDPEHRHVAAQALFATIAAHPRFGARHAGGYLERLASGENGHVVIVPIPAHARGVVEATAAPTWWLDPAVVAAGVVQEETLRGVCGICGESDRALARLIAASKGAALISFNEPSGESYGRRRAHNAPTCTACAASLARGLDRVLDSRSHRLQIAKAPDAHYWWPLGTWDPGQDAAPTVPTMDRAPFAVDRPKDHEDWFAALADGTVQDGGPMLHVTLVKNMARWVVADVEIVRPDRAALSKWAAVMRRPRQEAPAEDPDAGVGGDAQEPVPPGADDDLDVADPPGWWTPLDVARALLPHGGPAWARVSDGQRASLARQATAIQAAALGSAPWPSSALSTAVRLASCEGSDRAIQPRRTRWAAVQIRAALLFGWSDVRALPGGTVLPDPEPIPPLDPFSLATSKERSAYFLGRFVSAVGNYEWHFSRAQVTAAMRVLPLMTTTPSAAYRRLNERLHQWHRSGVSRDPRTAHRRDKITRLRDGIDEADLYGWTDWHKLLSLRGHRDEEYERRLRAKARAEAEAAKVRTEKEAAKSAPQESGAAV